MLENFSYCPTLYTRVAEIKALTQLPAATKDRIFPLVVARPWPNARHLTRTWEKISEAIGNRRFALDLDRTRRNVVPEKPALSEFNTLFEDTHGFENYYDIVLELPMAIPVLRLAQGTVPQFDVQADHVERLDRGVVFRIEHGLEGNFRELIDKVLNRFSDLVIFIDAGWSNDLLGREGWASEIIEYISRNHPGIEIVTTGSSFPDSFANIGERGIIPVKERNLYDNLVRRHNAATLIYGDWGSTRPPSMEQVPMRNIPRIDLPVRRNWVSFRRDKESVDQEDYTDIARRVVEDTEWPIGLEIWGTYIINCTARGELGAIRSPTVAAASRINIHMHRQAFFDQNDIIQDGDEPFTDN